jgi:hypothetical protein
VVSACSEALILDTRMDGSVASERAESYATQDGEVLGTVCFAQTAPIFAEGDVQDLVERIFNPPVGASRMEQLLSVAMGAGRDEITTLDGDFKSPKPPLCSNNCKSLGIDVISFDFSSPFVLPNINRLIEAQALILWIDLLLRLEMTQA